MNDALGKGEGKVKGKNGIRIHKIIADASPSYFSWFKRHRSLRNSIKMGVQWGATFGQLPGREVEIYTCRINEPEQAVESEFTTSVSDIDEAFARSAALMEVIEKEAHSVRARLQILGDPPK
jgi:hypothetical protein